MICYLQIKANFGNMWIIYFIAISGYLIKKLPTLVAHERCHCDLQTYWESVTDYLITQRLEISRRCISKQGVFTTSQSLSKFHNNYVLRHAKMVVIFDMTFVTVQYCDLGTIVKMAMCIWSGNWHNPSHRLTADSQNNFNSKS